jgi:hypothetical protein
MRKLLFISGLLFMQNATAQVTGGDGIMQFLNVPNNAHITAMGGMCVSNPSADAMLGLSNPALLRPAFHNTLSISQNFYYAKTKISNVHYAKYISKYKTMFAGAITYVNYGQMNATDIIGNTQYTKNATDFAIQVSASRNYLKKWRYGSTIKFANSNLLNNKSSALITDFGLVYFDTSNQIYFGAVAKNIGFQLLRYNKLNTHEALPFDMQIGFSKKFLKAPFRINVIAHHLYQWNIRYNNPADLSTNTFFGQDSSELNKKYIGDKILRHFNFGIDIVLGKRLEFTTGYSHQRRGELALADFKKMSGFSFGLGINLNKLKFHYGRSIYGLGGAYNEIAMNINMKSLFGLGTKLDLDRNWN